MEAKVIPGTVYMYGPTKSIIMHAPLRKYPPASKVYKSRPAQRTVDLWSAHKTKNDAGVGCDQLFMEVVSKKLVVQDSFSFLADFVSTNGTANSIAILKCSIVRQDSFIAQIM